MTGHLELLRMDSIMFWILYKGHLMGLLSSVLSNVTDVLSSHQEDF